ncbi:MAG: methyltransferase domain-containing protein [Oscillibacter sp.]|nr:methyltransferase domain-containing protein [Oscillibacter sp.]
MFQWTPDVIRFRKDAAAYNCFDDAIAGRVAAALPPGSHVCDAGCGLGFLSLALARRGFSVTAVDTSAAALSVLQGAAGDFPGLKILHGDLFAMEPETFYDAMVFCFFGSVEEALSAARNQCRGRLFLIKKDWETHRFALSSQKPERFSFSRTCRELEQRKIPYAAQTFSLEMGQPFRTKEDAILFLRLFDSGIPHDIGDVSRLLVPTRSEEFPYCISSCRPLGLIGVETADIPAQL